MNPRALSCTKGIKLSSQCGCGLRRISTISLEVSKVDFSLFGLEDNICFLSSVIPTAANFNNSLNVPNYILSSTIGLVIG